MGTASPEAAWPLVLDMLQAAKNEVEVLPEEGSGRETLNFLQVTERSVLGAIALHTGGLLIDRGRIRILGSGCGRMHGSLVSWNRDRQLLGAGGFLVVAHDPFGGFFVLNGGIVPEAASGECLYLAPDSLEFERLEKPHSAVFRFCLEGDLDGFYDWARWDGWREDIDRLNPDQGLFFYPFMWTKEGKNLGETKRGPVPMTELFGIAMEMRSQLGISG